MPTDSEHALSCQPPSSRPAAAAVEKELPQLPWDDDKLKEECGIFGVFGVTDAASFVALGLHALQHRGQEACGIASIKDDRFYTERHQGLVGEAFGGAFSAAARRGGGG